MIFIYALVLFYSLSRYYDLSFMYMDTNSPWWQYMTYTLTHKTFTHLLVNVITLAMYWNALNKLIPRKIILFICLVSTLAASFLCAKAIPTLGASAITYSLMGIFMAYLWVNGHNGKMKYTVTLIAMVSIQTLIGYRYLNWQLHLFSFGLSLLMALWISRKGK